MTTIRAAIALIAALPGVSQTLFHDSFTTQGTRLDLTKWTTEIGPSSFLGRTQLADWVTPGGVGQFVVGASGAQLTLNTFNPTGLSLYGTHGKTIQSFQPAANTVIQLDTRLQLTSLEPGLVYGIYFYGCDPATCATKHDEIDIELVTNVLQPGAPPMVQLNRYANEGLGAGNGAFVNLPAGFDPLAAHNWTIRWSLVRIDYLVDGTLLSSSTDHVPQGPMQANEIAWGPSTDWAAAYSAQLQPVSTPAQNQAFTALLTSVTVSQTTAASVTSLSPVVSSGASQLYTFQFSDTAGYQALGVVNVLINNVLDGRQACYLAYSVPDGTLYLVPDSGGGLLPGIMLGGTASTSNGQCTVSGAGSFASGSGTTLTLMLNVNFASSFGGNKVVYLAARDSSGSNSGWQTMGVHGVPPLPSGFPNPVGMSPSSGTTATAAVTLTYQDATSAHNLQTLWALINSAIDGREACYVAYYAPGNQLYLYPDNGDGTQAASMALTGTNSLSNSQCTVSAQGSGYVMGGAQGILTLNIGFKPAFAGHQGVWMAAQTLGGAQTSAWQALGNWSVPAN